MARVIVTGAAGMLGCSLVPVLRAYGHAVVRWSRTDGDARLDPSDWSQARRTLDAERPEVIVNLAAKTSVDDCEREPHLAFVANVRIVENLARWIRLSGTDAHLVQISTDQVYDGVGAHREEDVHLTNYYGFSKYAGELAAATTSATVLRTNFFGKSQSPARTSLSDWIVGALRRDEPITVFDDVWFSPLTLRRLSDLIDVVVERRVPGVFNLGSVDGMTKADFAIAVARATGLSTDRIRRGSSTEMSFAARRPLDMRMNSERFATAFGVTLPYLRDEIETLRLDYDDVD